MGKRSDNVFERRAADFYPTPRAAVPPLIQYLRRDGVTTFAELCCGNGDLIRHLEAFDLHCVHRGDIHSGQDALQVTRYVGNPDVCITNPPFADPDGPKRNTTLLRALIRHFLDLGKPFWLLLPHDFSANKNSARFMKKCSDVVVVGRIRWITGTKHTSKDNFSWFRFSAEHVGKTAFHNDRGAQRTKQDIPMAWVSSAHAPNRPPVV